MDIYVAREDPEPGVTGGLVADAVPLAARRTSSSSRSWSAVAGHLASRAPARRPRADARGRRRHLLGPEVLDLLEERTRDPWTGGVCTMSMLDRRAATTRHGGGAHVGRPRRGDGAAGHQGRSAAAAVRCCAGGAATRSSPCSPCCWSSALLAGSVWLVFFSSYVTVEGAQVDRQQQHRHLPDRAGRRRPDRHPSRPGRPRRDPQTRVEAIPAVRRAEVSRSWPHRCTSRSPSAPRSPWSDRGNGTAGARPGRRDLRQLREATPRACRWCAPSRDTPAEALAEGGKVIALPALHDRRARRHDRGRQRRPDRPGPAQRPPRRLGQRRGLRAEGRGARRAAAPPRPGHRRHRPRPPRPPAEPARRQRLARRVPECAVATRAACCHGPVLRCS